MPSTENKYFYWSAGELLWSRGPFRDNCRKWEISMHSNWKMKRDDTRKLTSCLSVAWRFDLFIHNRNFFPIFFLHLLMNETNCSMIRHTKTHRLDSNPIGSSGTHKLIFFLWKREEIFLNNIFLSRCKAYLSGVNFRPFSQSISV